jgi:hypothetical protein
MRFNGLLLAVAFAAIAVIAFRTGYGFGYRDGFRDEWKVRQRTLEFRQSAAPDWHARATGLVRVEETTVICIDNSPATVASGTLWR